MDKKKSGNFCEWKLNDEYNRRTHSQIYFTAWKPFYDNAKLAKFSRSLL
jgi:hypothetical protein